MLSCDAEGVLDCPTYWRNDDGTRTFQRCNTTEALHGDERLPFTCGSQLRRSLIKYFYRNYSRTLSAPALRATTAALLNQTVRRLFGRWTDLSNFGCLDPVSGRCLFSACNNHTNFYVPCLDTTDFQVPLWPALQLADA